MPGAAGSFDATAVKNPSIIYAEGQWHLFYTARGNGRYSLGYAAAPALEGLAKAARTQLSALNAGSETFAAPQVFYFRPRREWFLIYQTAASNYQPVYATTKNIADPNSWSRPRDLVRKTDTAKWIDFWIICDDRNAYLFYTREHNEVVAMITTLAQFPNGFSEPKTVFQGVHEAVHIYREQGEERYAMLFERREEDLSRTYGLAESKALLGPWRVTDSNFARASHGELIRRSADERLIADLHHPRFLIQELIPESKNRNYPEQRWFLKLIE